MLAAKHSSNDNQGTGSNDNQGTGSNDNQGTGSNDNQGTGSNDNQGTGSNDNQGTGSNDNQGTPAADPATSQGVKQFLKCESQEPKNQKGSLEIKLESVMMKSLIFMVASLATTQKIQVQRITKQVATNSLFMTKSE